MRLHPSVRRLLTSFLLSTLVVGGLVGNAYIQTVIGYPEILQPIGLFFVYVGFAFAIPPYLGFLVLNIFGLAWELRGRESFIESNPGLWIYCVVFYTLMVFSIRSLWQRYRHRRTR